MLTIDISGDIKPLQKAFTEFQKKQVPFATALALTRLAQGVVAVEGTEIDKTFDSPTAFTRSSITLKSATKADLTAIVYPREIASHYLEPYVNGGNRDYGNKKGFLVPKGARVNRFGNLTQNALKNLESKPNVFIGAVRLKGGVEIRGVWQRPGPAGVGRGKRRGKGALPRKPLKLLIRFEDTTPVPRRLPFYESANTYLKANVQREFLKAFAEAMKTAKP